MKAGSPNKLGHALKPLLDTVVSGKIDLLFEVSCLSSLIQVHQKPPRLFRLQSIEVVVYVQIPGKMLIVRTALKGMFPLFSVNTGVDKTKDQT